MLRIIQGFLPRIIITGEKNIIGIHGYLNVNICLSVMCLFVRREPRIPLTKQFINMTVKHMG